MPREGRTGTGPDGTRYIFMDGAPRRLNSAGLAEMGEGFLKAPDGRTFRQGPQGGFTQIGGPSREQTAKQAERVTGINMALTALDDYDKQFGSLKTPGPLGIVTNPQEMSQAKSKARDLQMRLKNVYDLGAITGPDWEILQSFVADPDSFEAAAQRGNVKARLSSMAGTLGNAYRRQMEEFSAIGGNPSYLQPLFRSPRSAYTEEEWGSAGQVPKKKAPPIQAAPRASGSSRVINGKMYYQNPQTGEWFDNKEFR